MNALQNVQTIGPADIYVLESPVRLTGEARREITASLQQRLGKSVIILEEGLRLYPLGQGQDRIAQFVVALEQLLRSAERWGIEMDQGVFELPTVGTFKHWAASQSLSIHVKIEGKIDNSRLDSLINRPLGDQA